MQFECLERKISSKKTLQLNGGVLVTVDKIHMLIDHCQAM